MRFWGFVVLTCVHRVFGYSWESNYFKTLTSGYIFTLFIFHTFPWIVDWCSKRMGTSVDDGMCKSKNLLHQWQSTNWAPEVAYSPFRALSGRQLKFPYQGSIFDIALCTSKVLLNHKILSKVLVWYHVHFACIPIISYPPKESIKNNGA